MQIANMKGFNRPKEKEILNSGLVVVCENIVEDTTNPNQTVYTWLEKRYSQLEYMALIEAEKERLKEQLGAAEARMAVTEDCVLSLMMGGM